MKSAHTNRGKCHECGKTKELAPVSKMCWKCSDRTVEDLLSDFGISTGRKSAKRSKTGRVAIAKRLW